MNVAGKPVELGDSYRALVLPGLGQRRRQLRPRVERVSSLAGLDLDELSRDLEALSLGEPGMAARWASMPRPDLACLPVETRI